MSHRSNANYRGSRYFLCPWNRTSKKVRLLMPPRAFKEPTYTPPNPRGRPRKALEHGHTVGTTSPGSHVNNGDAGSALVHDANAPVGPRLLDLHSAATYMGISEWSIRDLEAQGVIPRVRIPLPNHGEMRKLLFCKDDLDALIDKWRDTAPR